MKKILETKRLYLRELTGNDYNDLCEILQDEKVMVAYEHTFSHEEVKDWLNKQFLRYKQDGFGLWAVILKETNEMIGQTGLTLQTVNEETVLEIGYLYKQNYWHHGYATEAAIGCKEYAFNVLNKNKVFSIIRDTNIPSQNVAKRVGMKIEKSFIKHYYDLDMLHYLFSIEKK